MAQVAAPAQLESVPAAAREQHRVSGPEHAVSAHEAQQNERATVAWRRLAAR
jgi:hypothetical protein